MTPASRLHGRVLLVSPHLDDAVLSLGASAARAARSAAALTILTVFAGDPESSGLPRPWDVRSGFTSAGEAGRARRKEDARACALVGAAPLWLTTFESEDRANEEQLRVLLEPKLAEADVALIPGFPLKNPEHVCVSRAVLAAAPPHVRLGLYTEQPYAWWLRHESGRGSPASAVAELGLRDLVWEPLAAGVRDRFVKLRACRAYPSQMQHFGKLATIRILFDEARRRGELVAWLTRT